MNWPWSGNKPDPDSDSKDVMTATLNGQLETVADRLDSITIVLFDKIKELQDVSEQVTELRKNGVNGNA